MEIISKGEVGVAGGGPPDSAGIRPGISLHNFAILIFLSSIT
jgi:hypothetical protein